MKTRISLVLSFIVFILFISVGSLLAQEGAAEKVALDSSTKWLSFVDKGDYSKSWERAANLFRGMVTKTEWESRLNTFRAPLGKVSERNLKSAKYTKTLPDAPDGEYVVIQYDTNFKNKPMLTETVTTILEKDGKWKVAGYYITFPTQESPSPEIKK